MKNRTGGGGGGELTISILHRSLDFKENNDVVEQRPILSWGW